MPLRIDGNGTRIKNYHNKSDVAGFGLGIEIAQDLYRIQILYQRVFFLLNSYLGHYSEGNFDIFLDSLPEEVVIQITQLINNSELINNNNVLTLSNFVHDRTIAPKYVTLANQVMNSIKQILTDRIRIDALEAQEEICMSYRDILEDPQKLNEYIKEIQRTSFLFTAEATYNQPVELKIWYQVYLERHGPPGDGVFDSVKLAEIIEELVAAGLVNEDELIT